MSQLKTILNKTNTSPVFILTFSFLLSLIFSPPVDVSFDDKEIFSYIGRLIAKGSVPYRDVFDHKPPLVYFFNYFGPWGLWLIDMALVMLGSLLFFRLGQKYRLAWPWIPPLLLNLLLRNYLVCICTGMTRAFTATFILLFFCLLLGRSRSRYFWMGLLTAATFFMQQDQLVTLFPFVLYALLTDFFPPRPARDNATASIPVYTPIRHLLLAIAGAATLTFPILLYFGVNHSLGVFWECAFQFNFSWYNEKLPLIRHFRAIKDSLEGSALMVTFLISCIAGIVAGILRTTNQRLLTAALLGILFSFTSEYLSGKLGAGWPFYYYLLPLCSTIPILVFTIWAHTKETFLLGRKSQGFYGLLLCCLPFYSAVQHATHLSTHNTDLIKKMPEYIFLRQQQLKDYELYCFGANDWIYTYNQCNILAPSRWVYQHIWEMYPRWDADHRQLESIMSDLLRHHTKYIINDITRFRWKDPSARTLWVAFLQLHYHPTVLPPDVEALRAFVPVLEGYPPPPPGPFLWELSQ